MSIVTDDCLGVILAQNVYFRIVLITRATIAALAIILTFVLNFKNFKQRHGIALHINAKILLFNHGIAKLIYCLAVFIKHVVDLRSFFTFKNAEDLKMSKWHCALGQIPLIASWAAIQGTLCMMGFERLIATKYYKTYEKRNGKDGIVLVIFQWSVVAGAMVIAFKNIDIPADSPTCYFLSAENSIRISALFVFMAVCELIALLTFYLILRFNRSRRLEVVDEGTLTEKYQLDENIRTTKIMIPLVIAHFVCLFPSMLLFPIYSFNYSNWDNPAEHYAIFRETFDWAPLYCLIHPLVLFYSRKALRKNLQDGLKELGLNQVWPSELTADGRTHEQIRHFELLDRAWN